MNVFNRALVILEIVLLSALLIVAAVMPDRVLSRLSYTVQQAQGALQFDWPRSYIVFLAAAVLLILLFVLLLWLEVRPQARNRVIVRGRDGTQAEVSTSSVAQSLQYHIAEIADVLKVKSTVYGRRGGVEILLDLETTPEIDIPSKMDEVSQAARELVEARMGLRVANIKVHVRHGPYGSGKAARRAPAAQPSLPVETLPTELPAPESGPERSGTESDLQPPAQ